MSIPSNEQNAIACGKLLAAMTLMTPVLKEYLAHHSSGPPAVSNDFYRLGKGIQAFCSPQLSRIIGRTLVVRHRVAHQDFPYEEPSSKINSTLEEAATA
jgi:hypothetical protein